MPELTKYEKARIIGARSLQLSSGAPPLIEVNENDSSMRVAERELETGVIPLVVIR
ncbi:MAG: DNA-directed RNA polymerase subunit K [Candidatus Micrarchaeia archaeon]